RGALVGASECAATARFAGATGPTQPEDRRTEYSDSASRGTTARGATADDASWGWPDHGTGLCPDSWGSGALSMWQASRQLSGTDSVRGIDWRPATPRAHQQARQHTLAFLADRVGSRRRTLRSRLAASVPAPGNASWPSDRQGRDGPQAGGATVLDVAQGMGLSANFEVRFARAAMETPAAREIVPRLAEA